jgi:tetratricopeptide (TPR) repeat protein
MKKMIFLLLLAVPFIGSCSHPEKKADPTVLKAYDLRMQGRIDQALTLLDSIISIDSANAMAYYELSRVKHYMLLGGGSVTIGEILEPIDKASLYDSTNVIYAYAKAMNLFLNAYMAMHNDPQKVKERISEVCVQFEKVLKLKPGYPQAMLYLVEIYGMLPPEMGGDSVQAIKYADRLKELNPYFGAKATYDLAPEDTDPVVFWKEFQALHGETPDVLKEIGIAYLYKDDPESAKSYFTRAMELDSSKQILLLDLARYYMMGVMQKSELADSLLPISATFIKQYLESTPAPSIPMKAYALGMLVKTEMFTGHKEEAGKLMEEAKSLDPYFSRAFGLPPQSLFDPPDSIIRYFYSFFRPF